MPEISIIIPVYNSEKYLAHCLDSILCQSFKDFELILIDDGSKDTSGKICDEYAQKDKRVVAIHKENGGLCAARNKGLSVAKGKYLAFCDNDDEYLPGLLEENYRLAIENSADVVRFARKRVSLFENGDKSEDIQGADYIVDRGKVLILEGEKLREEYKNFKASSTLCPVWNGLYRRELINNCNINFDESLNAGGEDIIFNLNTFKSANKYVINNKAYYQYNKRENESASTKYSIDRVNASLKVAALEKEIIDKYKLDKDLWDNYKIIYQIQIAVLLAHKSCTLKYKEKKKILDDIRSNSVIASFKIKLQDNSSNKRKKEKISKKIWKNAPQRAIMGTMFNNKMYALMFLLVRIYFMKNKTLGFGF